MSDTLRARVEQAQALAAAATPGPWRSEGDTMTGGMDYRYVMVPLPVGASVASGIIARCQRFGTRAHEAAANADLMAAAPDLAALVADLWAAYATRAQDASVAVARACLERDEARKERDAARAEVARLRGEAEGCELVWVTSRLGSWVLAEPGQSWLAGPYIAYRYGVAEADAVNGAARNRDATCDDLPAACRQIATWARADGHTVPPHPLGWDVGVSDG